MKKISFHLAYRAEMAETFYAEFPNDSLIRHASKEPYITSTDIIGSSIVNQDDDIAAEIEITLSAREKINKIVLENLRAQKARKFYEHTSLGLMIDGKPNHVIQGLFQELNENRLWWFPSPTLSKENAIKEVEEIVELINKRIKA
jgi:hypothetical protein